MMNKIFKEPLLHFLLLGMLLYMASVVFSNDNQQGEITVSEGKIKQLTTLYKKTWQRSPTQQELDEIVQEYILEQAAYIEGVNLGLDKNDIVITRRVRQKLDFIAEESQVRAKATDEVLTAYLNENEDKFKLESSLSFKQVYLATKDHDDVTLAANSVLKSLQHSPSQDITQLGERYIFKAKYNQQNLTKLRSTFGAEFSQNLDSAELRTWFGPVKSSYGLHLVYIEEKTAGKLPVLSQIRSSVVREWEHDIRKESKEQYYHALLKRFDVTIHWPEAENPLLSQIARKY